MPLQRQESVVARHPIPVVRDDDPPSAPVLPLHLDRSGSRIEAVFNELLDDGGGPLDDLPCRDAIDKMIVEDADATHGASAQASRARHSCTRPYSLGASAARRLDAGRHSPVCRWTIEDFQIYQQ
jgi:hypothetical protein